MTTTVKTPVTTPVFPARKAVLAQFEATGELAPFTERRASALLEVMARPLIHHWLDALSIAGVKELVIATSRFSEQLLDFIGGGERWGFEQVEFINTDPLNNWQDLLNRLDTDTTANAVFASLNSFPVEPLNRLASSDEFWFGSALAKRKDFSKRKAFPIQTPRDLWQINMDQVTSLRETQIEPGTYVDAAIRLEHTSQIATRVVMDRQSKLKYAVVGKDSCIADGCELSETVVFSNTRLGSHLFADRLLIDGPLIYSVDSGCLLQLDDPAIATRLKQENQKNSLVEKMLAGVLLFLTGKEKVVAGEQQNPAF